MRGESETAEATSTIPRFDDVWGGLPKRQDQANNLTKLMRRCLLKVRAIQHRMKDAMRGDPHSLLAKKPLGRHPDKRLTAVSVRSRCFTNLSMNQEANEP